MIDITPGTYWVHKREGYEALTDAEEDRIMKAPGDANWHPAVSYRRTDQEDSRPYTRTVDDFLAKFTPVLRDEGDV